MERSLGLAAYRALTRRREEPQSPPDIPRPAGELVWLHAGEPDNLLAVQDLAQRLCAARQGLSALITLTAPHPGKPTPSKPLGTALHQLMIANEHPASVRAFLAHWRPDICIWVWGGLRPNLVLETAALGCPMFLIDADARGFDKQGDLWLPDLNRRLLAPFSNACARSPSGYRRLVQLGMAPDNIEQTSPLLAGGRVLPVSDTALDELSAAMGGRPAWFAAEVAEREIGIVLAAHKQALRLSHRLLLIVQTHDPDQIAKVTAQAAAENLTLARWDDGEFPDDTTQVLLTTDPHENGLFFRMAPVCFLGATLVVGDGGCDPLEAAALGSAILYGPRVRHHMPSYTRLAAAGAARIVNDADALGTAVSRLIAPDQAATMAHAGWDVISQGAALTDKVIDLVQDTLDLEWSRS